MAQGRQQNTVARLLFFGNLLGDRNKDINGKQPHTVLIVVRQILEQGYHLLDHNGRIHFRNELGEVVCRLSSHHGGLIVHETPKVLPEALLQRLGGLLVWSAIETGGGNLRGEPVGFGQAENHRNEVFFDLLGGQLLADFIEGLDSLVVLVITGPSRPFRQM